MGSDIDENTDNIENINFKLKNNVFDIKNLKDFANIRNEMLRYASAKINQQAVYLFTFLVGSAGILNLDIIDDLTKRLAVSNLSFTVLLIVGVVIVCIRFIGRIFLWNAFLNGVFLVVPYSQNEMSKLSGNLFRLKIRKEFDFNKLLRFYRSVEDYVRRENWYKDNWEKPSFRWKIAIWFSRWEINYYFFIALLFWFDIWILIRNII